MLLAMTRVKREMEQTRGGVQLRSAFSFVCLLKNCRFFVSEIDLLMEKKYAKIRAHVSHVYLIITLLIIVYLFSAIYTYTYTTETFLLCLFVVTAHVIKALRQR